MSQSTDYRRGRHVVSCLHAHLVFVTKYRHPVFTSDHLRQLHVIFDNVCSDFGVELVQHYWRGKRLWSESYFVGSVGGAPLEVVRCYIEGQRTPGNSSSA